MFRVCVRVKGDSEEVCIINCDAPDSCTMRPPERARMCYFRTFHSMVEGKPFIRGGNLNTHHITLSSWMEEIDDRYVFKEHGIRVDQPGMKAVFSHQCRDRLGDLALTFGIHTFQRSSKVGQSFSGASARHDLVIVRSSVPVFDGATPKRKANKHKEKQASPRSGQPLRVRL